MMMISIEVVKINPSTNKSDLSLSLDEEDAEEEVKEKKEEEQEETDQTRDFLWIQGT
jgi:hypothetical protein